jgi:putative tryptophan/tyrosine transport system substrate-binding protein
MKRREFITLVGGAVAWPVGTRAQQAAMPMIGVLTMRSPEEANPDIEAAFERSLAERGYVVGRNVTMSVGTRKLR